MRKPWIRVAAVVAFALPALMCVIAVRLDRSSIGQSLNERRRVRDAQFSNGGFGL
jgi:hypothetical protein